MSKELTKEEILSKRIGTYGFTKLELSKPIICPIEALDAMKEYSGQNTKLLIDEIAELKSKVSNWMDKYIEVNEENKKLQGELKDKYIDLNHYKKLAANNNPF